MPQIISQWLVADNIIDGIFLKEESFGAGKISQYVRTLALPARGPEFEFSVSIVKSRVP